MKKIYLLAGALLLTIWLSSCSDDENGNSGNDSENQTTEMPDWYYTGGQLGTAYLATSNAFEQPTTPVEENAEMIQRFKTENSFSKRCS